jgi:hypothetical protein
MHRGAKIPIRRHQSFQRLVRPLEIVPVDIEPEPPLAILQIGKHRPRQALIPERLPEALDLPQRLRMLRPRLEVPHSLSAQLLLERRRAPPGRVLPPVVGQHFLRDPILRHRILKCVEHEKGLLLPLQGPPHQEARVVVEKGGQVEPLMAAQEKAENVRLPELVRLRPLKPSRRRGRSRHCRRPGQSRLVQQPAHFRLADPDRLEPPQHVSDPPRPVLRVRLLQRHHRLAPRILCRLHRRFASGQFAEERLVATLRVHLLPQHERRVRHPEGPAHVPHRGARNQLLHRPQLHFRCVPMPIPVRALPSSRLLPTRHLSPRFRLLVRRKREGTAR